MKNEKEKIRIGKAAQALIKQWTVGESASITVNAAFMYAAQLAVAYRFSEEEFLKVAKNFYTHYKASKLADLIEEATQPDVKPGELN